ncbi:glycosyltransferase family 4 protein [Geobacter sp.]|uniref:glycosyltransferase family 4 protein n=1 Tax=Geobacter sp. TaxID=46610 RepID=UPI001AC80F65|nr:glycosyltransferase family 4 protein [Geobacter sp.]CAG0981360.1 D-inositol 3-phosphate glycosyltransferase [Anaerolineae bacterium]
MLREKRRILYCENGVGYGGAVISLINLLEALDRDEFEPHVLTTASSGEYRRFGPVSVWATMSGKFFDPGKVAAALPSFPLRSKLLSLADYLFNVFPQAFAIITYARRNRIDIIHINNDPVGNLSGVIAARIVGIPCVCHVRGTLWDSSLTKRVMGAIDYFLPVSKFIRDEVLKFGVSPERVTIVPEGFDFSRFSDKTELNIRDEFGIPADAPLVGIAGVLMEWKGQETVIRSMRHVLEIFPECRLIIMGEAPEGHEWYRERLESVAEETGTSNRIVFTGFRKDTEQIFRQLDIVVHASLSPEPFGRVIVEGMAAGAAVVASALGAPPEILEEGVTGMLVPPGDPYALGQALVKLLADDKLRRRIGKAAREEALSVYGLDKHAQLVEGVYRQLRKTRR